MCVAVPVICSTAQPAVGLAYSQSLWFMSLDGMLDMAWL